MTPSPSDDAAAPAAAAHGTLGQRVAWALVDVASSAFALVMVTAVYALYFKDVVVGDARSPGEADRLWGVMTSGAMALVAVTSPFMGALADRRGVRRRLLGVYTALGVAGTAACGLVGPGDIALGMGIFMVAVFAFEGSYVFYDSLLPGLVPPDRIGRWSGIAWAGGYLGGLACLLIVLGFAEEGRFPVVFGVVAAWWALFTLPALLSVPEPPRRPHAEAPLVELRRTIRMIRGNPDVSRFLVAFFLYNDGVATTIAFAALYASGTLGMTTGEVMTLLAGVQVAGAAGAFALGLLADRLGQASTVRLTLVAWGVCLAGAGLAESKGVFTVVGLGIGAVMGATQSVSRGLLASIAPPGREAELFGFKSVAGKLSAVVGPLLFGAVSAATGSQRLALASVGVLFIAGFLVMLTVDERRARDGWRQAAP